MGKHYALILQTQMISLNSRPIQSYQAHTFSMWLSYLISKQTMTIIKALLKYLFQGLHLKVLLLEELNSV